jgi:2-succinyl-5-enolpyruvyl-6-hydroxy-3-cyclohexene-1-carboxylate synthase
MNNIQRSQDLIQKCMAAGVEEFCVCAGSRNASLISVLSRTSNAKIYSFFDERAAAFFALGRMKDSSKPVGVVVTSGTAVAEILPACIEAYYQKLPLVIISADRPKSFRNTGSPQSIEQVGLFASYTEFSWDIDSQHSSPLSKMNLI